MLENEKETMSMIRIKSAPINNVKNEFSNTDILVEILRDQNHDLRTLEIQSMYGSINLASLSSYFQLQKIEFATGHLEKIEHIPLTVKTLICKNNNLTEIEITEELETLILTNNQIQELSFPIHSKLRNLQISKNQLKSLSTDNLSQLEILNIESNDISLLDLDSLPSLKVLYCGNNANLRLLNVNEQEVEIHREIEYKNTKISMSTNESMTSESVDLDHAIQLYFQWKQQEDIVTSSILQKKQHKNKSSMKGFLRKNIPCANCGKLGTGIDFTQDKNTYSAKCGAIESSCSFQIQIKRGKYQSLQDELHKQKVKLENAIELILQETALSLLLVEMPTNTSKQFDQHLKRYLVTLDEYTKCFESYTGGKESDIHEKQSLLQTQRIHMREWINTYRDTCTQYFNVENETDGIGNGKKHVDEETLQNMRHEIIQESMTIYKDVQHAIQKYQSMIYDSIEMEQQNQTYHVYYVHKRDNIATNINELEKPIVEIFNIPKL